MIPRPLTDITYDDCQRLIADKIVEGQRIEYKRDLPGNSDKDKISFLRAVSSLANAAGGDLVYGIEAIDGLPQAIRGVPLSTEDEHKLRLENLLRDGLQPRIAVRLRFVPTEGNRYVLIVRVAMSRSGPHRVVLSGHGHFYGRNSAGGYQMDTDQLRAAFANSEREETGITEYRRERIRDISSGHAPLPLASGALLVCHVIPRSAPFSLQRGVGKALMKDSQMTGQLAPFGVGTSWGASPFDGGCLASFGEKDFCRGYTFIDAKGIIEAIHVFEPTAKGERFIYPRLYEAQLLEAIPRYLQLLPWELSSPASIFIALLRARHYRLYVDDLSRAAASQELRKRDLELPEAHIDIPNENFGLVFKPTFDMIWNAFGYPEGTPYINSAGIWIGLPKRKVTPLNKVKRRKRTSLR